MDANEIQHLARQAKQYLASIDFWYYCKYMDRSFFSENKLHLKTIAHKLQLVYEGKIKKLMISMPPRSGKSYTVSLWCSWILGKDNESAVMRNSYAATLAEKFSYDIRDIIKKDIYLEVFPGVKLKADKRRVDDWAIEGAKQSSYFCAGVGGAITGKGCNKAGILDDPIKNLEDALSETILDKTWNWYISTHRSRLESGCPEVHIGTRWSKKDPMGMLLDSSEADEWEIIIIPALIDGKSFCEEVRTTEEFLTEKDLLDEFIWEAVYMQNPIEAKGLLFPISELKRFSLSELHSKDGVIAYTDTADEGTDNLCSLAAAVRGDNVYIIDVIFTQDPVEVTESAVALQYIDNKVDRAEVESNSGGKSFAKNVERLVKEHNTEVRDYNSESKNEIKKNTCRTSIRWKPNTVNKETRILMKSGKIKKYFWFRNDYKPGSNYDRYMRELTSYIKMAKNKKDDAPDATTGLCAMVEHKITAIASL
jgi:hypothetical protein